MKSDAKLQLRALTLPLFISDSQETGSTQQRQDLGKEGSDKQALATSLSAGEKQMLNLARAMLLPNIRILVCDEPTSNIDMATDKRLQQVYVNSCTYLTQTTCHSCLQTRINDHVGCSDIPPSCSQIIRTHFPKCTIITIAHRLDTVVDNDKVVIMDAGSVTEFGPPFELLQKEGSMLRTLGINAGNLDQLIGRATGHPAVSRQTS